MLSILSKLFGTSKPEPKQEVQVEVAPALAPIVEEPKPAKKTAAKKTSAPRKPRKPKQQ